MSNVDDRVVRLDFNNSAFSRGVNNTLSLLGKLKSALTFSGSEKGIQNVENAANRFSLSHIAESVDGIRKKFSALSVVAITALANIANRAVSAGLSFVKSFTLAPITAGFHNYETQINAVQTIMANTGLKGSKGLGKVNAVLAELNKYANQTVYNFSDMAKNIGTFTAAGVKLKPATAAIKGIANLAALSGSNAEQASGAMYQLSQALSAGTFKLQDYNSVVNAGLGGKVFQTAIFNAAKAAGTLKNLPVNETFDQWTKAGNSFRGSLQSGFVTSKVLTTALQGFTGDLSAAQLKALGYTKQQIKSTLEVGKTATNAATQIKTFTQLQDALKEEVATAYSAIFKTIFGNITDATSLFSKIHTSVENSLTTPIYNFNKTLEGAVKLGARADFLKGIINAIHAFSAVLKPIHDAFREVFPPATAQGIANLAKSFESFTARLKIGADTAENIKRTFAGFFAALDIGKQIVSGIFHVILDLVGGLSGAGGGILSITGNLGDFLVALDKSLREGGRLSNFFDNLGNILAIPIQLLSGLGQLISGLFSGFHANSANGLTGTLDRVNGRLSGLQQVGQRIHNFFANLTKQLQPAFDSISQAFSHLGDSIANAFSGANLDHVFQALNTGLLAGIIVLVRKFLTNGFGNVNVDFGGGLLGSAKEAIEGLTGKMKAMQTELKAKALLEIAGAIGLITASVVALSLVNADKLSTALKAMAVGFGELLGAFKILTTITSAGGAARLTAVGLALNLVAGSLVTLSGAIAILAHLNPAGLARGLGAVVALLAALSLAVIPLSKNSAGLIRVGIGLNEIAVALNILFLAVKGFSTLSYSEIARGLTGVAGALVAIAGAAHLMPKNMVLIGAGILAISVGMLALYEAVKGFAKLSYEQLAKGIGAVAISLVGIAGALRLMPKGLAAQGAGLLIVAGALLVMSKVISTLGGKSFAVLGKGIGALAAALLVLAVALDAMEASLPGAAALTLASVGLVEIAKAISILGNLSVGQIIKGLVALAGGLTILAAALVVMDAATPALVALGIAALGIGVGIGAAAAGVGLLATGLATLAGVGAGGVAVLIKALQGFIATIPEAAKQLALGLIQVLKVIGENGPAFVQAFGVIIASIATAIIKDAPKIGNAILALVNQALRVIVKAAPQIIHAGLSLLLDLLKGIRDNIGRIVGVVAQIIVRFLNAVASHIGQVIKAGLNLIVKFLQGISSGIVRIVGVVGTFIVKFIGAVSNQLGRIVHAGANLIIKFIEGIGSNSERVARSAVNTIIHFVNSISNQSLRLINAGAKAILHFLNGIADAINRYAPQFQHAGARIAGAIINGMTGGLASKAGSVVSGAVNIAKNAVGSVTSFLGIHSPSRVFRAIGENMGEGWTGGIQSMHKSVVDATKDISESSVSEMKKTISGLGDLVSGDINIAPVIAPVLDLSNVKKDAGDIGKLISAAPINASVSLNNAKAISAAEVQKAETNVEVPPPAPTHTTFEFNQTNTSPVALSPIEIYRRTNNQLAQAKLALGLK